MKKIILAALLTITSYAHAGIIIASSDSNINASSNSTFFNNVFGNQNVIGLNSALDSWSLDNWDTIATQTSASYSQSTTLSSANLVGADWLIASSGTSYSVTTLQIIKDFLAGGGNLWVGGEANVFTSYAPANQLLSYVGSSMTLNQVATTAYNTSSNTNLDAYTNGTTTFESRYTSSVAGGVALYANNGNAVLAIDRATFGTTSVPEPSSIALLSLCLAGLGFSRRKQNS